MKKFFLQQLTVGWRSSSIYVFSGVFVSRHGRAKMIRTKILGIGPTRMDPCSNRPSRSWGRPQALLKFWNRYNFFSVRTCFWVIATTQFSVSRRTFCIKRFSRNHFGEAGGTLRKVTFLFCGLRLRYWFWSIRFASGRCRNGLQNFLDSCKFWSGPTPRGHIPGSPKRVFVEPSLFTFRGCA